MESQYFGERSCGFLEYLLLCFWDYSLCCLTEALSHNLQSILSLVIRDIEKYWLTCPSRHAFVKL